MPLKFDQQPNRDMDQTFIKPTPKKKKIYKILLENHRTRTKTSTTTDSAGNILTNWDVAQERANEIKMKSVRDSDPQTVYVVEMDGSKILSTRLCSFDYTKNLQALMFACEQNDTDRDTIKHLQQEILQQKSFTEPCRSGEPYASVFTGRRNRSPTPTKFSTCSFVKKISTIPLKKRSKYQEEKRRQLLYK